MMTRRKTCAGMTLIEVLIALAIISIAMTAIIKATSQNIQSTTYLQNKTLAFWVAQEVLNEVRTGLQSVPSESDGLHAATTLLDKEWYWHASLKTTPNPHIKKIKVKVFDQQNTEDKSPLITLEGYLYHAPDKDALYERN